MALTREHAQRILDIYIEAWQNQDPDLIVTIFTEDATYHERVLKDPIPDREAIREYWATKVVRDQANIRATLIDFYVDTERDTLVADWEARFDDLAKCERKRMREFAILEFDGDLVKSLRECWSSEPTGALQQS